MNLNKETRRRMVNGLKRWLARLPDALLIDYFMSVRLVLLVTFSLAAIGLVLALWYAPGGGAGSNGQGPSSQLDTQAIDELEYWLEERDLERGKTLVYERREYFVSAP